MAVFRDAVGLVWNIGVLNGAFTSFGVSCNSCLLTNFETSI